jgi:hypothetical protein
MNGRLTAIIAGYQASGGPKSSHVATLRFDHVESISDPFRHIRSGFCLRPDVENGLGM